MLNARQPLWRHPRSKKWEDHSHPDPEPILREFRAIIRGHAERLDPRSIASPFLSDQLGHVFSSRQFTFAWQRTFVISAWDQPLFGLTPQIADPHGVDRAKGQL